MGIFDRVFPHGHISCHGRIIAETVRPVGSTRSGRREGNMTRIEKIFCRVASRFSEAGFPAMILSTISLVVIEEGASGSASLRK